MSRKKKVPRPDIVKIDERTDARRIDGIWYHITFAKVPLESAARTACYDVVLREWITERWVCGRGGSLERAHGRSEEYAIASRPLGARELKALRLRR